MLEPCRVFFGRSWPEPGDHGRRSSPQQRPAPRSPRGRSQKIQLLSPVEPRQAAVSAGLAQELTADTPVWRQFRVTRSFTRREFKYVLLLHEHLQIPRCRLQAESQTLALILQKKATQDQRHRHLLQGDHDETTSGHKVNPTSESSGKPGTCRPCPWRTRRACAWAIGAARTQQLPAASASRLK